MLWVNRYLTSNDDLKLLPKNFKDRPISGYSDHSIGIDTGFLFAISRGASVVEDTYFR